MIGNLVFGADADTDYTIERDKHIVLLRNGRQCCGQLGQARHGPAIDSNGAIVLIAATNINVPWSLGSCRQSAALISTKCLAECP